MKPKKNIVQIIISCVLLVSMLFQVVSISGALTDYNSFTVRGYPSEEKYGNAAHKLNNGFSQSARSSMTVRAAIDGNGEALPDAVYCIQPGYPINQPSMIHDSDKSYLENIPNVVTTAAQKEILLRAVMTYGENEGYWQVYRRGGNAELSKWFARYIATQILLWEVITEDRDANFNKTSHTYYVSAIIDDFQQSGKEAVLTHYNDWVSKIQKSLKTPNFNTTSAEMIYKDGVFTKTLTDSNNVLSEYTFKTSNPLVSAQVKGNQVVLTSEYPITNNTTITFEKNVSYNGVKYYEGKNGVSTQAFLKGIPSTQPVKPTTALDIANTVTGKIEIQKVSTNTSFSLNNENYSLAGAKFSVTGPNGFSTTLTTDDNGYASTHDKLPFGTYKIKETVAPKGYILNTNEFTVVLNENTPVVNSIITAKQQIGEDPKGGVIKVTKHDNETTTVAQGSASLNGAVFEVYNAKGNLVDTIDCGTNNFGISGILSFGTYTVKEKTPPIGYTLATTSQTVTLSETDQNVSQSDVIVKNVVIKGTVEITKYKTSLKEDGTYAEPVPFSNVKFTLKSKTTGLLYNAVSDVTDENGKIIFENLPYDTYTVLEETPEGYENSSIPDVVITENEKIYSIEVINKVKTANLLIEKHTKDDINISDISFNISGTTIDGRNFVITTTTDNNGQISLRIPFGEYKVVEQDCEANKYYKIPEAQQFVVSGDKSIEFFNEAVTGEIAIEKYLQNSKLEYDIGEGVVFNLSGTSYAGYAVDTFVTTDKNGLATFKDIPVGIYVLKEVSNEVNYKHILQEPIDVEVATSGVTKMKVLNNIKTSTINIIKNQKGATDIFVSNAEYTLFDEDGNVFKVGKTDKDGKLTFENIPFGKYVLKETEAPFGYHINPQEYDIDVCNHAEIIDITTEDELILSNIVVSKQSSSTGEYLSNTEFTLYNADTNEALATVVTDENGVAKFFNVAYGNYVIKETNPPEGYANDSEPQYFALDNDYDTEIHEFKNTPIPQTGSDISNSILFLILTFMLFCLSIGSNRLVDIIKQKKQYN